MDIRKVEPPGATALPKTDPTEDNLRPPLFPSEKYNATPLNRKPRDVASRYKDGVFPTFSKPGTPKRFSSPNAKHTFPTPAVSVPKRAQSAERRRPVNPIPRFSAPSSPSRSPTADSSSRPSPPSSPSKPSTPSFSSSSRSTTPVRDAVTGMHSSTQRPISNRTLDGLWPSMRGQSSSLQSESPTLYVGKNESLVGLEKKRASPRGRSASDQLDNPKLFENSNAKAIDQHRWPGMLGGRLSTNVLSRSVDHPDKACTPSSLLVSSRMVSPKGTNNSSDSATKISQFFLSEEAEQLFGDGDGKVEQDTKSLVNSSILPFDKYPFVLRPIKTHASSISPIPVLHRPWSPSKVLSSSTVRGMLSPSRTGPSAPISSFSSMTSRVASVPSLLNYNADIRKGKRSASHTEDAHQLRLLCNINLQWQFVNAQADKTFAIQKVRTESALYDAWNSISKLRDSVAVKRIDVECLQQEMKLHTLLKEQMAYLQHFVALEKGHCNALAGVEKAVKATALRLPVIGGARANTVDVRNAITSAVDIMQLMGPPICYLLSKVEGTKSLFSELSAIAAEERFMLDDCREFLSTLAALQVQEYSLRTQIIQLRRDAHKLD